MRGSIFYQSAQLTQVIFQEKLKKEDRTSIHSKYYTYITSYKTMETYRSVWNNLFSYLREYWKIKNCEKISSEHIEAYLYYKIEYYQTKSYMKKLSCAIRCLENALNLYSIHKYGENRITYDFSVRKEILNKAMNLELLAVNYEKRHYANPEDIIKNLKEEKHKLAAYIQLEGGARVEGVTLIKLEQLKGYFDDSISNRRIGKIQTKEKGGKVGDVQITASTYHRLEQFLHENSLKVFKVDYQQYVSDIRSTCEFLNIKCHSSHGFRWCFARNRVREYQKYSYSYKQALQGTSWEMKHFRANITEHYLG